MASSRCGGGRGGGIYAFWYGAPGLVRLLIAALECVLDLALCFVRFFAAAAVADVDILLLRSNASCYRIRVTLVHFFAAAAAAAVAAVDVATALECVPL